MNEHSTIALSIIIVNYNGKHFLKDCLESIAEKCRFSYEIIMVDNRSEDGSQDFIKSQFPEVILIENEENYGFAKGNNIGAAHAIGENLLLLNNDVILLDELDPIMNKIKDKEVGVIGVQMLDKDQNYSKSAGKFPRLKELIFFSTLFLSDEGFATGSFTKEMIQVDWVQGSFMLVKREDYFKVNGLDESYFMYVEDVDFCKKISELGKKNFFFSEISYIHFGGFNPSRQPLLIEGFKIYVAKHFKGFKNVATFILSLKKIILKLVK